MRKSHSVDAEFEGDVGDALRAVELLRKSPSSVSSYRAACTAIRQAKLLFLTLDRTTMGVDQGSADALLQIANDAVYIAKQFSDEIPANMRLAFDQVSASLKRHLEDLKSACSLRKGLHRNRPHALPV